MAKYSLKIFLLALYICLFNCLCFAATGAATKYEVKITQFDLYNSGTGSWVTVFTGLTGALDIASVSGSSQFVGTFLSGLSVPDGTYTKCKVTPATTFKINGTISGYHTTAATTSDGNGRTVSVASNSGTAADCDVTILQSDVNTVGATENSFTATPITVKDGTADRKVRVFFDVSSTLSSVQTGPTSYIIYPNPPTVTVSIENL